MPPIKAEKPLPAPSRTPPRSIVAPVEPVYLNTQQAMRLLQLSERQFRMLRDDPRFPLARCLGPRSARWHRDDLVRFVETHLPRVSKLAVPPQFAVKK